MSEHQSERPKGMSLLSTLLCVMVALAIGFGLGYLVAHQSFIPEMFAEKSSPAKGKKSAKITIVEYSDYQCPFCKKAEGVVEELLQEYQGNIKVIFKQNPLAMHDRARPASYAALAAFEQSPKAFWAFHEKLFENQADLSDAVFRKIADEVSKKTGLDVTRWEKDRIERRADYDKMIEADVNEARANGLQGTPGFMINGTYPIRGAVALEEFKKVIDPLLQGEKPQSTTEAPSKRNQLAPNRERPEQADTTVYKALIEDAPVKGSKNALVTIVAWSDFECPFCSRAENTVAELEKKYGEKLRIVFKQNPLAMHKNATLAAEAALAAKEQGKFWEMHDKLFTNQQKLSIDDLQRYAQEIGLNLPKFKEALKDHKFKAQVDKEMAQGAKLGVTGTPAFFINGKKIVGAQPLAAFSTVIDLALQEAEALMKNKKIKASKVYDEIMKTAAEGKAPASVSERVTIEIKEAPTKGEAKAPITIVEYSDYQCPYCSRVEPTLKQIEQVYGDKIKFVWKNYPLGFHQNARLAAEASLAANSQGKFWEMHDKLFAHQQQLSQADLERYAQELDLDMEKFKGALDSHKFAAQVEADIQEGKKFGIDGTPAFFINGRSLVGAEPFEKFKEIIDQELAALRK